jgi:hypothetical protein
MTNAISVKDNLKNIPVSPARFIAISAITILNAGIFANSTKECAEEAKRIYKNYNNGGMWRKIQAESKRIITTANENCLTFEKPYFINGGLVYGFCGDSLVPLCGEEKI